MTSDAAVSMAELAAARADAESLMTCTLQAYSPNGTSVVNGQTTEVFTAEGVTIGKVSGETHRHSNPVAHVVTIGGVEVYVMDAGLHIPLSAPVPSIRWEYQVTAVGAGCDTALIGRRYRVISVPAKSYATARRLNVAEVPQ